MSGGVCVAVDVGGTTTRSAVVEEGRIVLRLSEPTERAAVAEQIAALVRALGVGSAPVAVAIPGPLSADGREIAFTGNVRLRSYPLADLLERELGTEVLIDDDANCAALAEAVLGAAEGTRTSVTIIVGTGVGAGLIVDGGVFRGAHRTAGELGHIRLDPHGDRCSCGRNGCFEALVNGAALTRRAGGAADAAAIFTAARGGDRSAERAIEVTAEWIAAGVAAIASIFDPECVVLAGGVGRQDEIVKLVREIAPMLCIEPLGELLDVRQSGLGDDAGLLGAALLVNRAGKHT